MKALVIAIALVGCGSKKTEAPPKADPPPVATDPAPAPTKTDPPPEPVAKEGEGDSYKLAANAPKDQVTGISPAISAKIAEATVEARKTYPDAKARYLKGLPSGEVFFAVTTLTSPGKSESVFIKVKSIRGTTISGSIASDIVSVVGYKAGDPYTMDESKLVDWLISKPDGSEEGNIVGKFLDTQH